jgi:hypothetical protein
MQVWRMRTGISITLKPVDRRRLSTVVRDRNAPHKHVWRAEIVLLSADGVGTNEIMRRTRQVEDLCFFGCGSISINRFVAETNHDPKPFTWTADDAGGHCDQVLGVKERFRLSH